MNFDHKNFSSPKMGQIFAVFSVWGLRFEKLQVYCSHVLEAWIHVVCAILDEN